MVFIIALVIFIVVVTVMAGCYKAMSFYIEAKNYQNNKNK
ncbi:hypothetical protein SAMN05428976_10831 [Clostridium sp. USBA 49]|jgi:uncharacterized protein YceK|nr:hypothetical protein SAMN05428976_10831 [Clostridium sp. USBA 49]